MNRALVEGAAQVAEAKEQAKSGDLMASQAATSVGAYLAEGIGAVVQKRNNEFNDIMKKQLGKEGLTNEEYQRLYKKFKRRRGAFVYLDKKEQMDFERDLMEEAEDFKKNEADREEIAEILTDESNEINIEEIDDGALQDIVTGEIEPTKDDKGRVGYALNSDALKEFVVQDEKGNNVLKSYKGAWEDKRFTISEDGKYKTDKFGNKYTNDKAGFQKFQRDAKLYWIRKARETGDKMLMYNSTTGKREYLTPDEAEALLKDEKQFVTVDEIKEHVNSRAKDVNLANQLETNMVNGSQQATNLKQGDSLVFPIEQARNRVDKMLQGKDLYKAATKNMIGDTSFKDDLMEKLTTMDYTSLGIDEKTVKSLDPTNDGKISKDDARVITNKVLENQKLLKGMLTEYFTAYAEREFNANIPQELKTPKEMAFDGDIAGAFAGGQIKDGEWIPN